jgi:hypothetical protein
VRRRPGVGTAVALLLGAALALGAPVAPATGQQPAGRLTLVGQTPHVGAGGEFALRLRIDRSAVPPASELSVTVYDAVTTRSEFALNLEDRILGSPLAAPRWPLADLPPDPMGDVTVRLALQDPAQPPDPARVDLGDNDGVHPVRVVLRERGGRTIDGFTTHLIHLPGTRLGPKLGVALVLPFHDPPTLPPEGDRLTRGVEGLAAAAQALDANRALAYTLAPTPESVAALAVTPDERATTALTALRRVAGDHPLISSTFVPVHPTAMVGAGLGEELARMLQRGEEALGDSLPGRLDTRTWLGFEPLDSAAVDQLVALGIDRAVIPEANLEPLPLTLTLTRPFTLETGTSSVPAAVADGGLSAHFGDGADGGTARNPVLAANRLLADLAVLYLDEPGADRRGVVAMPPRGWEPSRAFLDALAAGVAQNPIVEAVTVDALFAGVLPAVTSRGAPLVRELAPPPLPPEGPGQVAAEVREVRARLASLDSILSEAAGVTSLLEERLMVALAHELPAGRTRPAYVRAVVRGIDTQLGEIRLPSTRSITLTARQADIPMTFQNRTGVPARVVVELESDKLDFPGGARREVELTRRNTTERFLVVARTSGAFPMRVQLSSPDGNLVIAQSRMTVRSTVASRLSLAISASAIGFLALWWGRHVLKGRRARRLVPH